ncbi:MAG: outer membrane beta-barrel protein [Candidatus Zixiibacteriota bacterium]
MKHIGAMAAIVFVLFATPILADEFGAGISAGPLYPVLQQDQESGYTIGLKIRSKLIGPVFFEPNLRFGGFGDISIAGVGGREGSKITFYGLDMTLGGGNGGVGPKPYLFIGGGVYNVKREGDETGNNSGWSTGVGVAVGLMKYLDIDLRGRFNIVSSEGSSSRKSAAVTIGVVYFFGKQYGGE